MEPLGVRGTTGDPSGVRADRFLLETLPQEPVARRRVELVERKGLGHPDTICDALVEAVALALGRLYLERFGALLHYNVDKALLVAGQCAKGFGWGNMLQPMELVVGDRATFEAGGRRLPVEETARAAIEAWVAANLPNVRPSVDLRIRIALAPGSVELRGIFGGGGPVAANDTAGASGYAPLSPTEALVMAVERFLNGAAFKAAFPDTGQDVKVFALRRDSTVELTVAMPLLCLAIRSESAYFGRKAEILSALAAEFRSTPFELRWALNHLDRPGRGADGADRTHTGTSAEDADSGQVGRGNRANGLIAFSRPTGGEAAPGKNPTAHVGKVYSVLSHRLAHLIHARCPKLAEVYVHLAARIGEPVDEPWTIVQVVLAPGVAVGDVDRPIRDVVATELARMPAFRGELLRGEYPVY